MVTKCLDRRIPDVATYRAEVAAWERARNEDNSAIDWEFITDDTRINPASFIQQFLIEAPLEHSD